MLLVSNRPHQESRWKTVEIVIITPGAKVESRAPVFATGESSASEVTSAILIETSDSAALEIPLLTEIYHNDTNCK